jgi:hypothetical protein
VGIHQLLVVPLVQGVLLEEGQDLDGPRRVADRPVVPGLHSPRRKRAQGVVVVVQGQPLLFEVVRAAHACCRLADLLDRGEQEPDQDGNDGDHHQQLDEGERRTGDSTESSSAKHDVAPNTTTNRKENTRVEVEIKYSLIHLSRRYFSDSAERRNTDGPDQGIVG